MSRSKKIALWWFAINVFCTVLLLIGAASVENIRTRNTKDLTATVMSGWERSTKGEKTYEETFEKTMNIDKKMLEGFTEEEIKQLFVYLDRIHTNIENIGKEN